MFNKKLKKDIKELQELVSLLDMEVRWLLYEKEQAKNPDKKLCPPIPRFRSYDDLSFYELKVKYRGSTSNIY